MEATINLRRNEKLTNDDALRPRCINDGTNETRWLTQIRSIEIVWIRGSYDKRTVDERGINDARKATIWEINARVITIDVSNAIKTNW